jgi:hypothetical protein
MAHLSIVKEHGLQRHPRSVLLSSRYQQQETQMTNPTNPPAEAAMQPVWAYINNDKGFAINEIYKGPPKFALQPGWRISELMERAEHERQMAAKDAEITRMRKALYEITKQNLSSEMDRFELQYANFEGAYDAIIHLCRDTLSQTEEQS